VVDISEKRHEAAPSRRRLIISVAASFGLGTPSGAVATRILDRISGPFRHLQDAIAAARPAAGVKTAVSFGDTIQQLVAAGIIDPGKFRSVYAEQGNIPQWVERLFVAFCRTDPAQR